MSTHTHTQPRSRGQEVNGSSPPPSQAEINAAAFITLAAESLQSLAYQAAQNRGNPRHKAALEKAATFTTEGAK
jgi:hypothetical protein